MGNFWPIYFLTRNQNRSGSLGLAVLVGGMLLIAAVVFGLQWLWETVHTFTQENLLPVLAVLGIFTIIITQISGRDSTVDPIDDIVRRAVYFFGGGIIFYAASFLPWFEADGLAGNLFALAYGVLFFIVVYHLFKLLAALVSYQCRTTSVRVLQNGSLVLNAWWIWMVIFRIEIQVFQIELFLLFLVGGIAATIAVGVLESRISS